MQHAVLTAPGMSCDHCKMTIESAGGALAGVSAIEADPLTKKVEVDYDEGVISLDEIRNALAKAGYPSE